MIRFDDLTPFHKELLIKRANAYYTNNRKIINTLIKGSQLTEIEPQGSILFFPARWSYDNWLWFQRRVNK